MLFENGDDADAGTATVLFNYSYTYPFFYENLGLAASADLKGGVWYTLYDSQGLSPAHSNLVGVDAGSGSIKHNVTAQRWSPFAYDNWATLLPTNDGTTIIGTRARAGAVEWPIALLCNTMYMKRCGSFCVLIRCLSDAGQGHRCVQPHHCNWRRCT